VEEGRGGSRPSGPKMKKGGGENFLQFSFFFSVFFKYIFKWVFKFGLSLSKQDST
jgi:hypothetical protein